MLDHNNAARAKVLNRSRLLVSRSKRKKTNFDCKREQSRIKTRCLRLPCGGIESLCYVVEEVARAWWVAGACCRAQIIASLLRESDAEHTIGYEYLLQWRDEIARH